MGIALIWAESRNGIIGDQNTLLWDFKKDMAHFKEKTLSKSIVMGRKTFESIGRELPGRTNLIMSRSPRVNGKPTYTKEEILELSENEEIVIIGGLEIYTIFMPYATTLYQTVIDRDYIGDTCSPVFNRNEFKLTEAKYLYENDTLLSFNTYSKMV